MFPQVTDFLRDTGRLAPFPGAREWSPLLHAGSWLVVAAIVTCLVRGERAVFIPKTKAAWRTGRVASVRIMLLPIMAEVLRGSGIADSLAQGIFDAFGRWAFIAAPMNSNVFGALANGSNAANERFMASQIRLAAEASLDVGAAVALQSAAALSLNMVSPVRASIICSLANMPRREREVYQLMHPFVLAPLVVVLIASILIILKI
jgi:lactate permease